MRPLVDTARWFAAIASQPTLVYRVDALYDGEQMYEGGEAITVPVTSGSVRLDRRQAIRGVLDITVADDGRLNLIPMEPADPLAPYGHQELQVWMGLRYAEGDEELVSVGIFRVEEPDIDDSGSNVTVKITAYDRSMVVSQAKFEDTYQIPSGTLAHDAIIDTLQLAIPSIDTSLIAETAAELPLLVEEEGGDPWAFCQGIAAAIGAELFFNGDGIPVLQPIPNPAGMPIAVIAEGDGGVLTDIGETQTRGPNRVVVTGESTQIDGSPPRAIAVDDHPTSPTYYYGAYGKYTAEPWHSEFITTQNQAEDAAAGRLANLLGVTGQIRFSTIPNPALEPSDVIEITRERVGISAERHIIESLTIPLGHGSEMSGDTRATTLS